MRFAGETPRAEHVVAVAGEIRLTRGTRAELEIFALYQQGPVEPRAFEAPAIDGARVVQVAGVDETRIRAARLRTRTEARLRRNRVVQTIETVANRVAIFLRPGESEMDHIARFARTRTWLIVERIRSEEHTSELQSQFH